MTHQKYDLSNYLFDKKPLIIKEIIEAYDKEISNNMVDFAIFSNGVSNLYELFLQKVAGNSSEQVVNIGVKIEKFRKGEKITLENFLSFMESARLIIEKWIISIPGEEIVKSKGIAELNKFFLDIQREITLQLNKVNEDRLKVKNAEVYRLEKERMQILSKLSNSFAHEIRNPLTSIKGFIQLLESRIDKPADTDERKYFDYINREIKELEVQVNQILFLSDRKNHQDYNLKSISLNQIVLHVLRTFQPIINEHRIQLDIKLPKHSMVNGIEDHLKLAVFKLLQNAVDALLMKEKERKIKITLNTKKDEVVLSVTNNGPPIPEVIKNSLFDPFVSTKELGKGIGLAITKQIVEKHHGKIYCRSEGKWTSFQLVFPYILGK
ncbi:signal transduction histidine kinase [Evansella vedderi]|uniref:histidine kinase n=1 Tax=Evansella vedderi TaxID=38282 RepID=A0ABT9ZSN1_9BACI|nr:HAMP domain-containing sensor histidine kinase [Evansella vedderi]MDQ0254234.1 signal transduction histidine kinase [Evansella vedderi]